MTTLRVPGRDACWPVVIPKSIAKRMLIIMEPPNKSLLRDDTPIAIEYIDAARVSDLSVTVLVCHSSNAIGRSGSSM